MTVDTFDSPLKSIDFPSITLCTSSDFQPDNWALTERVLNSFKYDCDVGNDACDKIREDLKPFFRLIFDLVSEKIDALEFSPILMENELWLDIETLTPSKINHLYWAFLAFEFDLLMMEDVILDHVGRRKALQLYKSLPKQYNGSVECNEACFRVKEAIVKQFVKADVMTELHGMKLGTFLRQFSNLIGFSFKDETMLYHYPPNDNVGKCYEIGVIETLIFEEMERLSTQFGLKTTLHDIPNVFANGFNPPHAQFYPLHTFCNSDIRSIDLNGKLVRPNASYVVTHFETNSQLSSFS